MIEEKNSFPFSYFDRIGLKISASTLSTVVFALYFKCFSVKKVSNIFVGLVEL